MVTPRRDGGSLRHGVEQPIAVGSSVRIGGWYSIAGAVALIGISAVLAPVAAFDTSAPAESGIAESTMRVQPIDDASSPDYGGFWEPYNDGNWLSFDLDFTNGGGAIEMIGATVVYRDDDGSELTSVTVDQPDLALAILDRGNAPETFADTGGTLTTMGAIDNVRIRDLAFGPDGLLFAAGHGNSPPLTFTVAIPPDGYLVARYDADGALDSGFDGNGKVDVDLDHTGVEGATAVAVDALSRVFVGGQAIVFHDPEFGEATRYWALALLDVNGNPAPLFGDGGTLIMTENTGGGWISDLARDQNSMILAAGRVEVNGIRRAALARLTSLGEIDDNFGLRIATVFPDDHESAYTGVAVDSQNRVYVSGWHGPPQELDEEALLEPRTWFVIRFQDNGLFDETFAPADTPGLAEVPFFELERGVPAAIAIDSEDRIVTVGSVSEDEGITSTAAVVRHLPNGNLDTEFLGEGGLITDANQGGLTSATDVAIDASDRIVVTIGTLGAFVVMRLDGDDGSFDGGFGQDGVAVHDHPGTDQQDANYARSVAIAPGNRVVVGGGAHNPANDDVTFALLRLTEDGRLDSNAFVPGGERVIMALPDEALSDDERAMPFDSDDPLPATVDVAIDVRPVGGDETWTLEWTGIDPAIFEPAGLPDDMGYLFPLRPPENLLNDQDLRYRVSVGHELRRGNTRTHHRRVVQSIGSVVASNDQRYAYDIVAIDEDGNSSVEEDEDGEPIEEPGNEERYAWGQEVIAIADGDIVDLDDGHPENPEPGVKLEGVPRGGNSITIDHGNGEYSRYSHMQAGSITEDLAIFPCSLPERCTVEAGDRLGLLGNSGNSGGPHLHFVLIDGDDADIDEGLPVFFNNIMFDEMLQTSVSMHSRTVIDDVLPAPSEIMANPPSPSGTVEEIESNDTVESHHAVLLPTTVQGRIDDGEAPTLAVRGDPVEDIFRVDLDRRGQLQVALATTPEDANLDVYLVDDHYNLLNEGRAGWGPDGSESVTAIAGPGAYYVLVTEAAGAESSRDVATYNLDIDHRPYAYEYAAKVVCGVQEDVADMRLARGFYATTVNVHSSGPDEARLFKKLALAYPPEEQAPGKVLEIGEDVLRYDEALKTDCDDLRRRLFPGPSGFPTPYIEGFVVIQSTESLDVTAVYTTTALDAAGAQSGHSSIDVEHIPERGLGVDLRIDKEAQYLTFPVGAQLTYFAVLYTIEVHNNGPATATGVRVADEVFLDTANVVGAVVFIEDPIDLPPGGAIENLIQVSPAEVTFDLAIGDIAAGTARSARFWALGAAYEIGSPPAAVLIDTATITGDQAELLDVDNTVTVETQLLP